MGMVRFVQGWSQEHFVFGEHFFIGLFLVNIGTVLA